MHRSEVAEYPAYLEASDRRASFVGRTISVRLGQREHAGEARSTIAAIAAIGWIAPIRPKMRYLLATGSIDL
jgi:hypothetical protein